MTPELIELYKRVQGRRGPYWAEYDKIYCERCCGYDTAIAHMKNTNCEESSFIWLAPVWDDDCPERCLWAWVDWERWHLSTLVKPHRVAMFPPSGRPIFTNTLPEALLRAIKAQEAEHE